MEIEKKTVITLEITLEEAEILYSAANLIGGKPSTKARKFTDRLCEAFSGYKLLEADYFDGELKAIV